MRILLRSLLSLALVIWLGAELFLPVVAATVFRALALETHVAGAIVGSLLRTIHLLGLVCGVVALTVLSAAPAWGLERSRAVLAAMLLLVAMLTATAYSQFVVTPAMERNRIRAGGAIDKAAESDPARIGFNRLHKQSVRVETLVMLLGVATVVLVAATETR